VHTNRSIVLPAVALLLLVTCSACSRKPAALTSKQGCFRVKLPKGFQPRTPPAVAKGALTQHFYYDGKTEVEIIVSRKTTSSATISQLISKTSLPLVEKKRRTIGGVATTVQHYRKAVQGKPVRMLQAIFDHKTRRYFVYITSQGAEAQQRITRAARVVLDSFHLIKNDCN